MAARKDHPGRAWTPERVRERIRTGLITRRLADHVLGKIEMTATQVQAALGLLRKTLPDLSAMEHSGEVRHREITDEPITPEEWEARYSDMGASEGTAESLN